MEHEGQEIEAHSVIMKKRLSTAAGVLALLAPAADLWAQGDIFFANFPASRITNALTGQPIFGTNVLLLGLYIGPAGSTEARLNLFSTATNIQTAAPTDPLAGRFSGGSVGIVHVPEGGGSTPIALQVRAWSLSAGTSYETAYAAALAGDSSILLGMSELALVSPGVPPGAPTPIFKPYGVLDGFTVGPIPEPSIATLAALGIGVSFLVRSRTPAKSR